jgi:hypothetical protein
MVPNIFLLPLSLFLVATLVMSPHPSWQYTQGEGPCPPPKCTLVRAQCHMETFLVHALLLGQGRGPSSVTSVCVTLPMGGWKQYLCDPGVSGSLSHTLSKTSESRIGEQREVCLQFGQEQEREILCFSVLLLADVLGFYGYE